MMDDFVSWHFTKTGVFSVRSCCHAEWDHQHGEKLRRTNSYGTSSMLPVWKNLWALKVPAKIKIHTWRCPLGAILCNGVLANRHMQTSSQCELCRTDCESIKHAMFMCPRVEEIWKLLGIDNLISHVCSHEADGGAALEALLLEALLRDTSARAPLLEEVDRNDLLVTAMWYIWWERRKASHGETVQSPPRTAQAISALVLNYTIAKKAEVGEGQKWVEKTERRFC